MNTETANAIRDRIQETPQDIRVLCPRGHFTAHVTLVVQRGELWMYIDVHDGGGGYGFRMAAQSFNVCLNCTKCRYTGVFASMPLAVELAAAALAGNPEHRMPV